MRCVKRIWKTIQYEVNYFFAHCIAFISIRYLLRRKKLRSEAIKTIRKHNKPFSEELCNDIIWKRCAHLINMDEYFQFDCANLSYREIEEYIGTNEKNYWNRKMNSYTDSAIFRNKYETYCLLKPYYNREVIRIQSDEDFQKFCHFVLSHGIIIVKPPDLGFGIGVHLVSGVDTERKARAIFNRFIRYPHGFIAEEFVKQSSSMAELHPQSVNTVRMITIRHRDSVHIWHPFLRIGRGESIVDNANAGGIECIISPDTGIVGDACDFAGNRYVVHPDTGKQLKGFQIPRWNEAIALAKELAAIFPQAHLIGWDLALTDCGWIVIEGNLSPGFGFQGIEKVGLKKEFKNELRQIRKNR